MKVGLAERKDPQSLLAYLVWLPFCGHLSYKYHHVDTFYYGHYAHTGGIKFKSDLNIL